MKFLVLGLLALMLISFGCLGTVGVNSKTENICVKNKFIDAGGESGSHYVVVSTAGVAYEIDRSLTNLFNRKSNPDVIYGSMEPGREYEITTAGFRIDVLYNYPLIQSATELGACQ